jgi:hypothetical protein
LTVLEPCAVPSIKRWHTRTERLQGKIPRIVTEYVS